MILTPPTMRQLLDDPVFRSYMRRPPQLPVVLRHGNPWQLWVRTIRGTWKTGQMPTYADAWRATARRVRDDEDAADVCLVSRRVFFGPPGQWESYKVRITEKGKSSRIETRWRWVHTFHWEPGLEWCGRCRRPSRFLPLPNTHHALRRAPAVSGEDNERCMFCGIRWVAMPDIDRMRKVS